MLLALIVFLAGARCSFGQDTPKIVRQRINMKLAQGDFAGAIPDLQMLIGWFGESKETQVVAMMQMTYYNLAMCHFLTGAFEEAEKSFRTYVKKYPAGIKVDEADVFIADSLRLLSNFKGAIAAYQKALKDHYYDLELRADIYSSLARCHLAEGNWTDAVPFLERAYRFAVDFVQRNWAATLLTTAYLKELDLDKVFPLTPYLLRPQSFASRSVAFNMAALEAGDKLFSEERYREALWVHRLVYPYDLVSVRSREYLEYLTQQAERLKEGHGEMRELRRLMRVQESMGELEEEVKAIEKIENYDLDLLYRVARGYKEMLRFWEGREMFLHIHEVNEGEKAEEALFLAFQCSCRLLPWKRAYEIGEKYMEKYPGGEYFDVLTLTMGQMYAKEQNWPKVIEHLRRSLEISPKHSCAAECLFLIGYASFMEEKFKDAVAAFRDIMQRFPQFDLIADTTYWCAMSSMFDGNYLEARKDFDRVLEQFPDCRYVEDSAFRTAVCDYGLSEFDKSDVRLTVFIQKYPKSKLMSEALMMRADIGGAQGRLEDAVKFYKSAMSHETMENIEYYNHCAFQCGQILSDMEDYGRLRAHFEEYLKVNREGSNIPMAAYWIGIALWNSGEQDGSLRYYRSAVETYGKDPSAMGIDLILDEWVGRAKRADPAVAKKAWDELEYASKRAEERKEVSLVLRLQRAFLYNPETKSSLKQTIHAKLAAQSSIEIASPSVLQEMLDLARKEGRRDFAVEVAQHMVNTFPESDYGLDARMVLAELAIENARKLKDPKQAEPFYAEAMKHLGVVREIFASSGQAGDALMILGNLYNEQKKYDEADECYKSVLGVKTWRSLWPEALYWRGECAFVRRDYDAACAYYERIYVMYGHYVKWTAKAYLRRAQALTRLYQDTKAVEVLNEMLKNQDLKETSEYEEGRKMLGKMVGS